MKQFLKKPAALILTAAMLISAASCSGNSGSGSASSTTTTTTASSESEPAAGTTTTPAETYDSSGVNGTPHDENTDTENNTPDVPDDTEDPSEEKYYLPTEDNVKILGRTFYDESEGTLWIAHSASAIEFTFTGTHACVDIVGDGAASGDPDSRARFAVYINDERTLDKMVENERMTYDLFYSETPEEVTVKIIKLSESTNSTFGIAGIGVVSENGISPTPAKDLKIEFIGDSITCGYGVDDEDKNHHFSTMTEDATRAYAYKTAMNLNADYSLVSYSGHGVVSGYTDNGKINTSNLVPPVYEQICKSYGSANGYFDPATPWDFSKFVPDYIVINLGTNDSSYITKENINEFIDAYVAFLKQVRSLNPDSYILCTIGTMGSNPGVKKGMNAYIEETGDTKISYLAFSQQSEGRNGLAADWHPTEATHIESADKLTEALLEIINGAASDNAA